MNRKNWVKTDRKLIVILEEKEEENREEAKKSATRGTRSTQGEAFTIPFLEVINGKPDDGESEDEGEDPAEEHAVQVDDEGEERGRGRLPVQKGRDDSQAFREGAHHTAEP